MVGGGRTSPTLIDSDLTAQFLRSLKVTPALVTRIEHLADRPSMIPILAEWHHREWSHFRPEETVAGRVQRLRESARRDGCFLLPRFRGHGYALAACRAIAPFVRSVYEAVTVTCDPDNHASIRTIERLGACFIDEVAVPPHDPQYQRGSRTKRRYRWTP